MAIEHLPASGWPTVETQLLMLTHVRQEELAEKFGLVFEDDLDDLSYVKPIRTLTSSAFVPRS